MIMRQQCVRLDISMDVFPRGGATVEARQPIPDIIFWQILSLWEISAIPPHR
jgi:hypothetical protein